MLGIAFGTGHCDSLDGDFNQNSVADAADYVLWRDRVGDYGDLVNGSGEGIFEGVPRSQVRTLSPPFHTISVETFV